MDDDATTDRSADDPAADRGADEDRGTDDDSKRDDRYGWYIDRLLDLLSFW